MTGARELRLVVRTSDGDEIVRGDWGSPKVAIPEGTPMGTYHLRVDDQDGATVDVRPPWRCLTGGDGISLEVAPRRAEVVLRVEHVCEVG